MGNLNYTYVTGFMKGDLIAQKLILSYSQKTATGLNFCFFFVKVLATSMTLFLPLSKVLASNYFTSRDDCAEEFELDCGKCMYYLIVDIKKKNTLII